MQPYETEINRQYSGALDDVIRAIRAQAALGETGGFINASDGSIMSIHYDNDDIRHWAHPFTLDDKVYVDTRPFLGKDGMVRNHAEVEMLMIRATAEYVWSQRGVEYEGIIAPLALVFAEWVTGAIIQRFDGTDVDRGNIKILAATYYTWVILHSITDSKHHATVDEVKDLAAKVLSRRGGGMPADYIYSMLGTTGADTLFKGGYPSLHAFSAAITESMTVNMGNFTKTTLMQVMGSGSWLGNDSVILSVMALEYPPVLAAMVERAMSVTLYRNKTRIGRAINGVRRTANTDSVASFLRRNNPS